ncbi:MAG: hypothetical protein ACI9GB_002210 [Halioglobus sp.]|jgi:hypothetical protein
MNDDQYLQHCTELLGQFSHDMLKRTEALHEDDSLRELAVAFGNLSSGALEIYVDGQTLVSRLFTTYPDFSPTFPRELLWFLGGDCLHYMPDDEIDLYQQLEDERYALAAKGEVIDFVEARAKLLKLQ